MKGDDIAFLRQLVNSLEEAASKLEECYKFNQAENFNKTKKFILQIQRKISEAINAK